MAHRIPKKLRTSQRSIYSGVRLWWKEEKKNVQEEAMRAFRNGECYESIYHKMRSE